MVNLDNIDPTAMFLVVILFAFVLLGLPALWFLKEREKKKGEKAWDPVQREPPYAPYIWPPVKSTRYQGSLNSIYINDLICEMEKEKLNIPKIVKLSKQMFEDLIAEITAAFLMEIDMFCTELVTDRRFDQLPGKLQVIIEDCQMLHDYPSKYCLVSPQELFQRANDLYEEMGIEKMNIVTKADRILQLHKQGKTPKEIANALGIGESFVSTTLTRLGYGIRPS